MELQESEGKRCRIATVPGVRGKAWYNLAGGTTRREGDFGPAARVLSAAARALRAPARRVILGNSGVRGRVRVRLDRMIGTF